MDVSRNELIVETRFLLKRMKPGPLTLMNKTQLLRLRNALIDLNDIMNEVPVCKFKGNKPFRPIPRETVVIDGVEVVKPLVPEKMLFGPGDARLLLKRETAAPT